MPEDQLAAIEKDLAAKLEDFDKIARFIWGIAICAFMLGGWSTALQWQISTAQADIARIRSGDILSITQSAKSVADKLDTHITHEDQVVQQIQLSQQQTIDQLRYLADDVKSLKK